jgi:hypothetical protein
MLTVCEGKISAFASDVVEVSGHAAGLFVTTAKHTSCLGDELCTASDVHPTMCAMCRKRLSPGRGLCVQRPAGRRARGILGLDALDLLLHAPMAHLHLFKAASRNGRGPGSVQRHLASHAEGPPGGSIGAQRQRARFIDMGSVRQTTRQRGRPYIARVRPQGLSLWAELC